jgi:hypothetical protein
MLSLSSYTYLVADTEVTHSINEKGLQVNKNALVLCIDFIVSPTFRTCGKESNRIDIALLNIVPPTEHGLGSATLKSEREITGQRQSLQWRT